MILLAGGAGYIGSHVNKLLARQGRQTVVFDNLSRGHADFVKWGRLFRGDLGDIERVRACFQEYPIRSVMHFSALAYVGESVTAPLPYYQNNVADTLTLLKVMREFEVSRLVFSSSCAVYGTPQQVPIAEPQERSPINPYGRSKLFVEQILQDCDRAYGLRSVCLRYFNAAGADPEGEIGERHDPETHLIPLVIRAAVGLEEKVRVFGGDYPTPDGTCVRDYVHVNDLAQAHILALEALESGGASAQYNLGLEHGFSVMEVIQAVRNVSGRDIRVVTEPRRPGDPPVLISNSTRAREALKWNPAFRSLNEIVKTAWDWHLRDREANFPG